ncbi:DUF3365 domain-containing protein [Alteromonas sp. C1M14]|uniref:Tll0287-like domain-containing protein n=1 Tax=Alteromonas sp. C1M14 TaxID=2841567 RepID=UPI001C094DE0|nr:DUF3365 domain-containing protein [Alteromonas sp. C1M14]MBU2977194.1 DUF3365 domain-containing protein [Alteromonas sp. C1M14]
MAFNSIGATSEDNQMAQARAKASALGGSLKSALQTAIANGGVENGIVVCHEVAGSLAAKLSDENWQVGRTSLKVRNIKNTPEPWASANLQVFAEQLTAMPSRIPEASYRDPQTGQFTYMRAIVTQPVCTACHGNDIQNNVMEKIQSLYPHDQATGFKTGDLRGAFIVTYTP